MLEELYKERCAEISDINEHLPVLREYASKVQHVTEFGVREGNSTVALAMGKPSKMISYDINPIPKDLYGILRNHLQFEFIQANVLEIEIEPTELLFIDTFHTYNQLREELRLHYHNVSRYIIFHDTATFGHIGEDGSKPGLGEIICDFLILTGWVFERYFHNNNGLTICRRGHL